MKNRKKTDFQKLQETWYKKLADSGFKDIEHEDGSINSFLPRGTSNSNPVNQAALQEYYYMCYHFLNEYKFENELEKVIWEYHTEGMGCRQIADTLGKVNVMNTKKDKIWLIVRELEKKMKARYLSI